MRIALCIVDFKGVCEKIAGLTWVDFSRGKRLMLLLQRQSSTKSSRTQFISEILKCLEGSQLEG